MQWYYSKNGMQMGPVSQADLMAKIASGEVAAMDLVWRDGMVDWLPTGQIEELRSIGGSLPQRSVPSTNMAPGSPYAAPNSPSMNPGQMPGAAPLSSGKATASMVLGIVGVVFSICACYGILISLPCTILAVIFGNQAKTQIMENPHLMPELGKAKAGIIMGWIGIAIIILWTMVSFGIWGTSSYSAFRNHGI